MRLSLLVRRRVFLWVLTYLVKSGILFIVEERIDTRCKHKVNPQKKKMNECL